jgi:hypothetical protein
MMRNVTGAAPAISSFGKVFSEVGLWLPAILPNCIALMIQMYAVSFFTAIPFYIYNNVFPDGGTISGRTPLASDRGRAARF